MTGRILLGLLIVAIAIAAVVLIARENWRTTKADVDWLLRPGKTADDERTQL